jgi:hypothetical protein
VLENDPAVRRLLGPKDTPARKRNRELLLFAAQTVAVAKELMARRLNPERAHVKKVLAVAFDVLGIGRSSDDQAP